VAHTHEHDHGTQGREGGRRALAVVLALTASFTVVEVVGLFDPVTRNDLAGSLITTVVCAATTAGGALAIKRLWRTPPPSRARDHYAP